MDFACQVEGGRVVLSPAPDQSYRILGKREQRRLTTCSPFDERCRRTTAYRFDLDCGGTKTSWISVVAALVPGSRSRYGNSPPMLDYAGPRARFYFVHPYGPPMALGPFGPPRRYPAPPAPWQTNLPSGFAPIPGRLAHFATFPDEDLLGPIAEGQSVPLPSRKPKLPIATAALTKANANNFQSASTGTEAPSLTAPVVNQAAKQAKALVTEEMTGAIPKQSQASARSAWTNLIGAAGLSFVALILFASVFVLSRRRSRSLALVEDLPRQPMRAASPFQAPRRGQPYPGFGGQSPQSNPPSHSEWLPSTLSEALDVLGASPETGAEMLKTLVKSLRRTWHPDLASHEEDRRARERKLKQVNVAWDIVCGKRRRRSAVEPQQA